MKDHVTVLATFLYQFRFIFRLPRPNHLNNIPEIRNNFKPYNLKTIKINAVVMFEPQRYPWKLTMIKNVEDNVVLRA